MRVNLPDARGRFLLLNFGSWSHTPDGEHPV